MFATLCVRKAEVDYLFKNVTVHVLLRRPPPAEKGLRPAHQAGEDVTGVFP